MNTLLKITLPSPIMLSYALPVRVAGAAVTHGQPVSVSTLSANLVLNTTTRTIRVQFARISAPLTIYGADDFDVAAADTPEQHAERVLQCLGCYPAKALQGMIDEGKQPPMPGRVPREIPNWRCKAVLHQMGLLETVEAGMEAMPEPARTVALFAWRGDGKVARRGPTVLALASALGLTDAQVDEMFIVAEAIQV